MKQHLPDDSTDGWRAVVMTCGWIHYLHSVVLPHVPLLLIFILYPHTASCYWELLLTSSHTYTALKSLQFTASYMYFSYYLTILMSFRNCVRIRMLKRLAINLLLDIYPHLYCIQKSSSSSFHICFFSHFLTILKSFRNCVGIRMLKTLAINLH